MGGALRQNPNPVRPTPPAVSIHAQADRPLTSSGDDSVRRAFKPTAKRPFVLGLPTGSTPIGIYKRFVEMYKNSTSNPDLISIAIPIRCAA